MNDNNRYKIFWDEKNKIARTWARGVVDVEIANALLEGTDEISKKYGDNIDWINDLSEITRPTAEARKILAVITGHPSTRKYAFVGASVFLRTVANFVTIASGQKNARHFATEEQALQWVKEV